MANLFLHHVMAVFLSHESTLARERMSFPDGESSSGKESSLCHRHICVDDGSSVLPFITPWI